MENITENPYFSKIVLTIIAVITKLAIDSITKKGDEAKGLLKLFSFIGFYVLPITIVVWINLDQNVQNTKLNSTLISLNIGLVIFNFLQSRVSENYKIVTDYSRIGKKTKKDLNAINETQAEKMKGLANNQAYILNELSKINDRTINYIYEKKK